MKLVPSLGLVVLLGLGSAARSASVTERFVSPNGGPGPGSAAQPWDVASANASAQAGDVVQLLPGVYNETLAPSNSGSAGQEIVFRAADPQDPPLFTDISQGLPDPGSQRHCVRLSGVSHIRIDGIHCDGQGYVFPAAGEEPNHGVNRWVTLADGSHHITVENGTFRFASRVPGGGIGPAAGIFVGPLSHNVRILNNDMAHNAISSSAIGGGDMIRIEGAFQVLVEGNTLFDAGHNLIDTDDASFLNVFRNNDLHNPRWRAATVAGGNSVFEGNDVHDSNEEGRLDDDLPALKLRGINQIVRRNRFFRNRSIGIKLSAAQDDDQAADDTVIYHNVFYDSDPVGNNYGSALFIKPGDQTENRIRFVNNAVYQAPPGTLQIVMLKDKPPVLPFPANGFRVFHNSIRSDGAQVWIEDVGAPQPLSTFESGYGEFDGNIEAIPLFKAPGIGNFRIFENSPLRNAGGFLTVTTAAGSGTLLPVEDAALFSAGNGIVPPDWIQLEGGLQKAEIVFVNYATNQITLDRSLSWTAGLGVSPPYREAAPDIGAHEYVPGCGLGAELAFLVPALSWARQCRRRRARA